MPGPAARVGDTTAHGGVIVGPGVPNVLIGGMPASVVGDMHTCPLATPGTPPIPHVGGPVSSPGAPTVLIGGRPAATIGSMCVCVGPPDSIVMGALTVILGAAGSGAAGAVAGGGAGAAGANASAASATFNNSVSVTKEEHWVEFQFVDKAGLSISGVPYQFTGPDDKVVEGVLRLDGRVRRDGLPKEGLCEVVLLNVLNARWDKEEAEVGDAVKMMVDVVGFDSGTAALFQIFRRDLKGTDVLVAQVEAETQGDTVEAEWTYQHPEETPVTAPQASQAGYSSPTYYFDVILGVCKARSGLLRYKHVIELKLVDPDNRPIADEEYIIYLQSGETRRGTLDGQGYAKVEDVPPGYIKGVRFPGLDEVNE